MTVSFSHRRRSPIPPAASASPCIPAHRTHGAYAQRAGEPPKQLTVGCQGSDEQGATALRASSRTTHRINIRRNTAKKKLQQHKQGREGCARGVRMPWRINFFEKPSSPTIVESITP